MKRFTLIVLSVVLAAAMLASCTQYRVIWIPGMDDQNTPSTSQSAKDTFSLIDALDEQLPSDIEKVMADPDAVPGLTRTDSASTISMASRSGEATYSATFSFNEYPVAGYGTIKTGTLTVNFQGTESTETSETIFSATTSKMDFNNLSVLKTNETVATPVEIKNLEGSSTAVISTDSSGKVTSASGISDSMSIKQSISSSTTITVDNVNVPAKDVADSNTSGDFASGLGNEAYPYIINTAEQFKKIGSEKAAYYKLGNNITLPSDLQVYAFYGILDGDNKEITYSGNEYAGSLFWTLNDATVKNLRINLGTGTAGKMLSTCTAGNVLIENVEVSGSIKVESNNSGSGYICFIGYGDNISYGDRKPATVTIKDCTNKLDVSSDDYSLWGIAPFIAGYGMPGEESESSVTLENCVNEGTIAGGYIGWVFGNQSGIENLKSINIKNCSNSNGGSVTGYIDCGNISWSDKDNKCTNVTKDASFENMVIDKTTDAKASLNKTDMTITINPNPTANINRIEVIGRYQVTGYSDDNLTVTPAHMTQSAVLATAENFAEPIQLNAFEAVDARFEGAPSSGETGEIIEINNTRYVYIPDSTVDSLSSIVHACVDTSTHKKAPVQIWVLGYNGDSIECVMGVTGL